jgi:hypothetical protein
LGELPEPFRTNLGPDYEVARRFVTEEIAGLIATAEPDMTDHSERHLADVMSRAYALLGEKKTYFSPYEIYLLAVSILFHDVGNLHGRELHNRKVAGVYDAVRKREPRFNTERTAVLAITGAHTGSARDGSKDTLRDLGRLSFQAQPVRTREVAAVLRFADELAEGPHRTSAYLQNHSMYKPANHIYHKYANISDYCIERSDGRIAITYNIDIEATDSEPQTDKDIPLRQLLEFCYSRITKLDQERRYNGFYCGLLSVFNQTGAWFTFFHDGQKLDLDIPPIVVSDLVVPGDPAKTIEEIDARYTIDALVATLGKACREEK